MVPRHRADQTFQVTVGMAVALIQWGRNFFVGIAAAVALIARRSRCPGLSQVCQGRLRRRWPGSATAIVTTTAAMVPTATQTTLIGRPVRRPLAVFGS